MSDVYRIVKPATIRATDAGRQAAPSEAQLAATRATRLIPGEVLVVYTGIRELYAPADLTSNAQLADDRMAFLMLNWILPIVGLLLTMGLRIWGTRRAGTSGLGDVQWPVVIVASITYCSWLLSQSGPLFGYDGMDPRVGATLLLLFGVLPPFVYKGSEQ